MNSLPILIVEDDEDDRQLILHAFTTIGRADNIRFFSSGTDFLTHLASLSVSAHPPLVILDYNMPMLSGGDILQRIRSHAVHHSIPVVAYSSNLSPAMRAELTAMNVLTCLQKGDKFEKLVEQAKFFIELIADDVDTILGL